MRPEGMRPEGIIAIEKKLLTARKETGLEIIANIAAQTGDYSHIRGADLKIELIENVLKVIKKKR